MPKDADVERARAEFRRVHGERLPRTSGSLQIPGLERPIRIHREAHGVPLIEAQTEDDAFYGLGFCQGQDRAFQLEQTRRVAQGRLSELIGALALPIDRLARRIGFQRAARSDWPRVSNADRASLEAFATGVNDGVRHGCEEVAHEFAVLGIEPTPMEAVDTLAQSKVAAMLLGSNWDAELARLRVLREDGLEALTALDPVDPEHLPVSDPPRRPAGRVAQRLAQEAAQLARAIGLDGGSNNWTLAPSRTGTGRPMLANDPHLPPMLPAPWYLVRLETPDFRVAGASFVGLPLIAVGHNGVAAWGATAAMTDSSDLFLEALADDGRSVRNGDDFVPCRLEREEIRVRGAESVIEEVLITPRGPIVGPALGGEPEAIALRASWIVGSRFRLPRLHRVGSFTEFRSEFDGYSGPATNHVYADVHGDIGWQLTGVLPKRKRGVGALPSPGWDASFGWEAEPVPFDEMPHAHNPACGFLATANNRPRVEGDGPFLGVDFADPYRVARIGEVLEAREDWDLDGIWSLQLDRLSLPWREMRAAVLDARSDDPDAERGRALLEAWDGHVSEDAPAASVFEMFVSEITRRVVEAKAPRAAEWALGRGASPLAPLTILMFRRMGHLVRLLREQPHGWLKRSWSEEIADALGAAVRVLRERLGEDASAWAWGRLRPLMLSHPIGLIPNLAPVFNRGPIPWGGDMHTVAQAGAPLPDPTGNPLFIASLRVVFDVGRWEEARFVLAGGQSGNPLSVHYDDQLALWRRGEWIGIPWARDAVEAAIHETLELRPGS